MAEPKATVSEIPSFPGEKLRSPMWICGALALFTFLVYFPVWRHDFVNYDDSDYVAANPHVLTGVTWANIRWAFTTGHASNWHPLTWLSHMADCTLWGPQAGMHHLTNVLLHVVNTILVFTLFRRLTGASWCSLVLAALFALHPLHVESVAWISERKDLLSAFFFLLTLWWYGRYAQQPEPGSSRRMSYLLALTFFAFGLMAKPMLVTLPFILLLLDYWPLARLPGAAQKLTPKDWLPLIIEKLPFFGLSLVSSWITYIVQKQGGAVSTSLSLPGRIANALIAYVRYLAKTFWPDDLSVLYPHPGHWAVWKVFAAAGCLLLVSAVTVLFRRRRPWLIVGWLWFVGMLVPVIGLIQVGIQSMADRYTYLPLIGLFLMIIWEGRFFLQVRDQRAGENSSSNGGTLLALQTPNKGIAVAIVALLLICSWLTRAQVGHWRNSETLFRHAVAVTEKNYLAYNNLGFYLSAQGKVAEAMENYRRSLEIEPNYEDARNNLGYALAGQKRFAEALVEYERALATRPNHAEVHNNLGNALAELGRIDEAIARYEIVLRQKPEHADAHNNLGIALAMKGKLDEAIPHFEQAIRYKANYASAHSNLGNAFAAQRKFDDAIRQYQFALRIQPGDSQAHNNLANVLAEQGKTDEAIEHYSAALRLTANNPEAHYNLGIALLRQGKKQEARSHFIEALRLKPDYEQAQRQLQALP